eukprot:352932-Chlamydomonas_euryale.AAC.15
MKGDNAVGRDCVPADDRGTRRRRERQRAWHVMEVVVEVVLVLRGCVGRSVDDRKRPPGPRNAGVEKVRLVVLCRSDAKAVVYDARVAEADVGEQKDVGPRRRRRRGNGRERAVRAKLVDAQQQLRGEQALRGVRRRCASGRHVDVRNVGRRCAELARHAAIALDVSLPLGAQAHA